MSKVSKIAAIAAAVPVLAFAAPVFADSPGQLQGGSNTNVVKNVTQKGSYSATTSASACDVVQYSVELHNTEYGKLSNIVVKATMPSTSSTSHVSSMTATTAAGGTTGTSGSVKVTTSTALSQSYVTGSTKLYDGNGTLVKTLADGITTSAGLNVGDLNGSTTEFVNFQAKFNCETPPKQIQVCELATKKIVTINENQFDSNKYSTDLTKCQETPVTPPVTPPTLPNTGAGNVIGIAAFAVVLGTVAGRLFLSRRQSNKA
jgi:LPXTG-motif cell wall-anchored protein